MDALMHRIEWTTLLFFAAMFVTMECLARLGLITWIGKQSEIIIQSVGEDYRLAVAIIIILWVNLASIFSYFHQIQSFLLEIGFCNYFVPS